MFFPFPYLLIMINAHNIRSNMSAIKVKLEEIKTVQDQMHESMENIHEDIKSRAVKN